MGKKVTKCDKGGGGSVKKVTSLIPKISFAVFHLFVLRKSVKYIISFNFCVTAPLFDENQVKYRTKSSRWKDYFLLIFKIRVCHFLVSDMGGGGSRQKMTKCDKGGGGSKIAILGVTSFLNGPLVTKS